MPFFNLHTRFDPYSNLRGCTMYTSSSKSPLRKTLFTLICLKGQHVDMETMMTIQMVGNLTTWEKVSRNQYILFTRILFSIRWALYLLKFLFVLSFNQNIHLKPMEFLPSGSITISYVPLFNKAWSFNS